MAERNPWLPDQWNLTEQMTVYMVKGSAEAERLARAAGSRVGGKRPPLPAHQVPYRQGIYIINRLGGTGTGTNTPPGILDLQGAFVGSMGFNMAATVTLEIQLSAAMALGADVTQANVTQEYNLEATEHALGADMDVELEVSFNIPSAHALGVEMAAELDITLALAASPAMGFDMATTLSTGDELLLSASPTLGFDMAAALALQTNVAGGTHAQGFDFAAAFGNEHRLAGGTHGLGAAMAASLSTSSSDTPSTIFGGDLVGWYKADVGVNITAGRVDSWSDQSGGGRTLANSTSGQRPVYNATGLNGGPAIAFNDLSDGTGSVLFTGAATYAMGGNCSIFVVCKFRGLGIALNGSYLAHFIANGQSLSYDNAGSHLFFYNAGSAAVTMVNIKNSVTGNTQNLATSTNYRLGFTHDGTNAKTYNNGSLVDTDAMGGTLAATGQLIIGASNSAVNNTRCRVDIAEIVVVDRDATGAEVTTLDAYFQGKWGL